MDISKIKTKRIDGLDDELRKIVQPGDLCYSLRTEKEGWILCDGRAVSRTDYSDLFEAIGTQYGEGDGTTTFNVPNFSCKFLYMDTTKAIGTYVEAGLPDPTIDVIYRQDSTTSGVYTNLYGNDGYTGAGYSNTSGADEYMQTSLGKGRYAPLAAICTNAIYGKSTTVQPSAVIVNYFIKH